VYYEAILTDVLTKVTPTAISTPGVTILLLVYYTSYDSYEVRNELVQEKKLLKEYHGVHYCCNRGCTMRVSINRIILGYWRTITVVDAKFAILIS
jgi:hypothetical protein